MASETPDVDRLASLIDHRTEDPDVEYKAWMDLSSSENKSKIAKHLCALSNYGGGWLIFGIADNGSHAEPHPGDLAAYNQDIINGIANRYLQPAFHCNVYFVRSPTTAKEYPVVRVPPHGAQPVCAKTDGPLVDKQRIGVTKGTHYIRLPGPRSEPINTPELWREVLHRCVLSEREHLLTSIGRLFERPAVVPERSKLDDFLDAGITKWNELQGNSWLVDPKKNRTGFGFQFVQGNGDPLTPIKLSTLKDVIRNASNSADAECSALGTFDTSHRGPIAPAVLVVDNIEGYHVAAVLQQGAYVFAPAYWRLLANGIGCEIRTLHEDTDWVRGAMKQRSSRPWNPGEYLSPKFQAIRAFEFVAFVRHLASAFPSAEHVRLVADYTGLSGRSIRDTSGAYYSLDRTSSSDSRRVTIEASVEALSGDGTADAVAQLINPILRLFDGWEISTEFIRKAAREAS